MIKALKGLPSVNMLIAEIRHTQASSGPKHAKFHPKIELPDLLGNVEIRIAAVLMLATSV